MPDQRSILKGFINSGRSPSGEWWLYVPAGFSATDDDDDDLIEIEAVCLTSRDDAKPDEFRMAQLGAQTISDRIHQPEHYREKYEEGAFEDETAALMLVTLDELDTDDVGRLLTHRALFQEEFDVSVVGMGILCTSTDPLVERACENIGIEVVTTFGGQ